MRKGIIDRLNDVLGRRKFLGTLTNAAGALVAGIVGIPAMADTPYKRECCNLCVDPDNCSFTGCGCSWSWCCCSGNKTNICLECLIPGTPALICNPDRPFLVADCSFAKCSRIITSVGECAC